MTYLYSLLKFDCFIIQILTLIQCPPLFYYNYLIERIHFISMNKNDVSYHKPMTGLPHVYISDSSIIARPTNNPKKIQYFIIYVGTIQQTRKRDNKIRNMKLPYYIQLVGTKYYTFKVAYLKERFKSSDYSKHKMHVATRARSMYSL